MSKQRIYSRKGFSLLEATIAVFLIGAVAILGARMLLSSSRSVSSVVQMKKVNALADLISEQLVARASNSFLTIRSEYDDKDWTVAEFLKGNSDLGYEGLSIHTAVQQINSGTLHASVTVSWKQGNATKQRIFEKTLYATTGRRGGAVVDVYVVSNDTAHTGMPNFEVTAPSSQNQTEMVRAITDSEGHAKLTNVLLSSQILGQPVQICARHAGSTFNEATYDQGYYDRNTFRTRSYLSQTITEVGPNTITFDGVFRPLGVVSGVITNADTRGPTSGLAVWLQAYAVDDTGNLVYRPGYEILTGAGGVFRFNNVLPTTNSWSLTVPGRQGSAPTIQDNDSRFVQGYCNTIPITVQLAPAAHSNDDAPQGTNDDGGALRATVYAMGALTLSAVKSTDLTELSGTDMIITPPPTPWALDPRNIVITSDGHGVVRLNNLIPADSNVPVTAARLQQGGTDFGWRKARVLTRCSRGVNNVVRLDLEPGYRLMGKVIDQNTHAAIGGASGMGLTTYGIGYMDADGKRRYIGALSQPSTGGQPGFFGLDGLFQGFSRIGIPGVYTDSNSVPFHLWDNSSTGGLIEQEFFGRITDAYTGAGIVGVDLQWWEWGVQAYTLTGTAFTPRTDSSGNFPHFIMKRRFDEWKWLAMDCYTPSTAPSPAPGPYGSLNYTCLPRGTDPTDTGSPPMPGVVQVNTSRSYASFYVIKDCYYRIPESRTINWQSGDPAKAVNFQMYLARYDVSGTVTVSNMAGNPPVEGIQVCDARQYDTGNGVRCATTNSAGRYTLSGPGVWVFGQNAHETGRIHVRVFGASDGKVGGVPYTFSGASENVGLPSYPACHTPVTIDFSLVGSFRGA